MQRGGITHKVGYRKEKKSVEQYPTLLPSKSDFFRLIHVHVASERTKAKYNILKKNKIFLTKGGKKSGLRRIDQVIDKSMIIWRGIFTYVFPPFSPLRLVAKGVRSPTVVMPLKSVVEGEGTSFSGEINKITPWCGITASFLEPKSSRTQEGEYSPVPQCFPLPLLLSLRHPPSFTHTDTHNLHSDRPDRIHSSCQSYREDNAVKFREYFSVCHFDLSKWIIFHSRDTTENQQICQSSKASLRIKTSPIQRKIKSSINRKTLKKSMVPAGKAHKPPHTSKSQLHHFSDLWMEDVRSQSLSPRHGVCAAGCGFAPRLLCTLRYRIRGHPFFPPYSPREEHLATWQ